MIMFRQNFKCPGGGGDNSSRFGKQLEMTHTHTHVDWNQLEQILDLQIESRFCVIGEKCKQKNLDLFPIIALNLLSFFSG